MPLGRRYEEALLILPLVVTCPWRLYVEDDSRPFVVDFGG
jgi:hypothetical protein